MKIGICEDNLEEQVQYLNILNNLGYNNNDIQVFNSGEELIQKMPELDLLFLDIEMKEISGIDVKNLFEEKNIHTFIVFYTTHTETMPQGFGANVLGFLRKPVTSHEISLYINKVNLKLERNYPIVLDNGTVISSDNVVYIKSDHNYTLLYLLDGSEILVRKSLQHWTEELAPHGFITIHRSYIANLYNISRVERTSLLLSNGGKLSISRHHLSQVKKDIKDYQLRMCNN